MRLHDSLPYSVVFQSNEQLHLKRERSKGKGWWEGRFDGINFVLAESLCATFKERGEEEQVVSYANFAILDSASHSVDRLSSLPHILVVFGGVWWRLVFLLAAM
jgi:hypothetical protein